jgi:hypothetical protein
MIQKATLKDNNIHIKLKKLLEDEEVQKNKTALDFANYIIKKTG